MTGDGHLSIGEVLAVIQEDFPDVTVSKIRFLETQGLIEPERTPSGYRRFHEPDVARLRWILIQQRDHFLPLKVIRERLDAGEHEDVGVGAAGPELSLVDATVTLPEPSTAHDEIEDVMADEPIPASAPAVTDAPAVEDPYDPVEHDAILAAARQAAEGRARLVAVPSADAAPGPPVEAAAVPGPAPTPAPVPAVAPDPAPTPVAVESVEPEVSDAPEAPAPTGTALSLTVEELARASGLAPDQLAELERYGLLASRPVGPATYYDGDAVVVAKLAAGFLRHGVEPRHLRMYRTAAEREASVFESVIIPLVKRSDADAHREARERLVEMARLGEALRAAMLRSALARYTDTVHPGE